MTLLQALLILDTMILAVGVVLFASFLVNVKYVRGATGPMGFPGPPGKDANWAMRPYS